MPKSTMSSSRNVSLPDVDVRWQSSSSSNLMHLKTLTNGKTTKKQKISRKSTRRKLNRSVQKRLRQFVCVKTV